jgi:3-mercaptopyruvate sulfurtransferase SseA
VICIRWALAGGDDGTFKSTEEPRALCAGRGVTPGKEVIADRPIGSCDRLV